MKTYEPKFMNEAMVAEVENLMAGEHRDALLAFSKDSANAALEGFCDGIAEGCIKNFIKGAFIGTAAFMVMSVGIDQGIIAYKKWKEKKATNVEKPGRVWEA